MKLDSRTEKLRAKSVREAVANNVVEAYRSRVTLQCTSNEGALQIKRSMKMTLIIRETHLEIHTHTHKTCMHYMAAFSTILVELQFTVPRLLGPVHPKFIILLQNFH